VVSFVAEQRAATGKAVEDISAEALRVLAEYDWPGNVRELRSAVEFAFIRCQGTSIQADDLPPEIVHQAYAPRGYAGPAGRPLSGPEASSALRDALARSRGNRTVTARLLGISRATLYRRMADLEIESAPHTPPKERS
jgi:DNA-binding NtrC family response regulator